MPAKIPLLNTSVLRSRLKLRNIQSESLLRAHHPEAIALLESSGVKPGSLRAHAARLITAGAAAAAVLASSPPSVPVAAALPAASEFSPATPKDSQNQVTAILSQLLPPTVRQLSPSEENSISAALHDIFGIHVVPELEGNRLNINYGLIGAEQHLPRFPGDSVLEHSGFKESGITPGRGAWGYFASSQAELTPDLVRKEKYYVAVQTLYLPDWSARLAYLRDWYQFRKVLVVNPINGKSIVADIADSGPAAWTGKHFGGSPEIMAYLGLNVGRQKGPVVIMFVDDSDNTVPLGPLEYNKENPPLLISS